MEQTTMGVPQQKQIDLYYGWRCLKKVLYVILLCSMIAGAVTYVATDYLKSERYSSSIHLAVITRGGNSSDATIRNINTAVSRNISVLNSDSLWTQMNKNAAGLKGTIKATSPENTNLITLTAVSSTAYDSLRLLKVALDTYPELSGYFGSGYLLRKMDSISASRISVSRQSPVRNAALAVFLVLAAGVGLTVFYVMNSDHIYNAEQAEDLLDLSVLGSLRFLKKKRGQKALLFSDSRLDISYYEEVDKLATTIQRHMDRKNYKTLMVSSIYENEGKTTVSANIALSLAKRGKRVVLVDADLRRPAVAKFFDVQKSKEKKGLSDYLMGNGELNEIMVRYSDEQRMYQVFQLKSVGNAERLLSGEKILHFFDILKRGADYIIVDTSPVGAVQDAEIMAAYVDAALLVIRQDYDRAPEINDVVDVFEEAGTNMLGGVLNMVKGEKTSIAGYGNYYYSYGYENTER